MKRMCVVVSQLRWAIFFVFFSSACSFATAGVIKNKSDTREFEYLVLENKLQVLLVSDPGAKKAAAALDVNVGSGEDPMDRFGLAHFLEHMLFLGTEKYPQPGEFQKYVDAHGGNHNAYTSLMNTNYFFDVKASYFEEALDRFAQFFISPLFLHDYVERERMAVHSEFTSKFSQESRRQRDVIRELVTPGHAISRFSTGNMRTLSQVSAEQLREELIAFYKKHYSANIMTLVVSSPQPLSELKTLVKNRFSQVPNYDREMKEEQRALFREGFLPAEVHVEPKKVSRKLSLSFPIPSTEPYSDLKPMYYIGNVLGHEGAGSLFSVLKKRAWATALSAGTQFRWRGGEAFSVNVYLTEEGLQNVAAIKQLVFATIEQLKRDGIERWRQDELRDLSKIAFDFYERSKPINEVSGMASLLHRTDAADVIWQSFNFEGYDPKLLKRFLSYLREDNLLSTIVAPDIVSGGIASGGRLSAVKVSESLNAGVAKKVSQIYRVPYALVSPEASLLTKVDNMAELEALQAYIRLPQKNPFVAKNFAILGKKFDDSDKEKPAVIYQKPNVEGWHLNDNIYDLPKTSINARYKLPSTAMSPEHYVATKIYVRLIKDALNNMSYNASLAGLSYSFHATARGIDLDFYGYSDSVDDLSVRVVKQIKKFNSKQKYREAAIDRHYDEVKSELLRLHQNRKHSKVYSQVMSELPAHLYSPFWTYEQVDVAYQNLTAERFKHISKRLFQQGRVQVFSFGNLSKRQAKREVKRLASLLDSSSEGEVSDGEVVKLKRNQAFLQSMHVDSQDVALVHYFQGNAASYKEKATLRLLERMISTPFYNVLRTEQQLGYIVFATNYPVRRVPGIVAIVQSPSHEVETVHSRMRIFFKTQEEAVLAGFEKHKQALMLELSEKPKNQMEWADFYWRSILEEDKTFEDVQQMLNNVAGLTREELEKAYREMFVTHEPNLTFVASNQPQAARSLAGEKDKSLRLIDNAEDFKTALPSYRFP